MRPAGYCIGVCLAIVTGCADSKPSTPAIWKVSDADNSLYLLGSFHALRPGDYPLSPEVDAAYADAEKLVFELPPEQMLSPELAVKLQKAGTLPAGARLQSRLPAALWHELSAWLKANPAIPPELFEQAKPWYAALLIGQVEMQKHGLASDQGLDVHFMERAGKDRKPVAGLEQASEQIALFDGMDETVQLQLLKESLQAQAGADRELRQLHTAWKAGDVDSLEKLTVIDFQARYPELNQRMNIDRNRAWLPQLAAMLDAETSDDALVVVGTLHLLGPDGVVQDLRRKGYTVERIK